MVFVFPGRGEGRGFSSIIPYPVDRASFIVRLAHLVDQVVVEYPSFLQESYLSTLCLPIFGTPLWTSLLYSVVKIFTGDLKWDRAAAMAETLASITREDILDLLDKGMLAADTSKRVSLLAYNWRLDVGYMVSALWRLHGGAALF